MAPRNETERRIRVATVHALAEHGYADLSIKRIEEELGQSSSLLYHYFDGKDDLVLSALDLIGERFDDRREHGPPADPQAALARLLGAAFDPSSVDESGFFKEDGDDFEGSLLSIYAELWAQATRDERYRATVTDLEDRFVAEITRLLREGIESGAFDGANLDRTAEHIYALLLHGLHTRTAVDRDEALETTRENLYRFLDRELGIDLRPAD